MAATIAAHRTSPEVKTAALKARAAALREATELAQTYVAAGGAIDVYAIVLARQAHDAFCESVTFEEIEIPDALARTIGVLQ